MFKLGVFILQYLDLTSDSDKIYEEEGLWKRFLQYLDI